MSGRRGIDEVVAEARRGVDRVAPADIAAEVAADALVIDIRPSHQRQRDGDLPGATVIDRNVLEWRLDPSSAHRIPEATGYDRRIIVVCNEGYASSLAAESLRRLGLHRATDLDGGFQAWRAFADVSRGERSTEHWDQLYQSAPSEEASWFEPEPSTSLEMIGSAQVAPDAPIIDVGGGASTLVDRLLARGAGDLTVLDVSSTALDIARRRLGEDAGRIRWITHDVLTWIPPRRYAVWHDRGVFHFLVEPTHQADYLAVLHAAMAPGGTVIVAAFADDGPDHCSGLPTARYTPSALCAAFGPGFALEKSRRENHVTPTGDVQPFTWVALRAAP